ncbi:uncharacterized protein LOC124180641 [Neodiprion fabricii]|uniref:uncharacterized protein LOC124180641 n=1 Tax=Neodiprion fabricii TaxID=2872261 RepID=UPI001ED9239A|nr:uncharacterized protein LOC124180641 [Neodiprion fabricii]
MGKSNANIIGTRSRAKTLSLHTTTTLVTIDRRRKTTQSIPLDKVMEEQLKQLRLEKVKLERLKDELKKQQEDLNSRSELAKQVTLLQKEKESQARILNELRRGSSSQQVDTTTQLMGGLMNHFQCSQLEIKAPKFSDEKNQNPLEFLADLENYFNYQVKAKSKWAARRYKSQEEEVTPEIVFEDLPIEEVTSHIIIENLPIVEEVTPEIVFEDLPIEEVTSHIAIENLPIIEEVTSEILIGNLPVEEEVTSQCFAIDNLFNVPCNASDNVIVCDLNVCERDSDDDTVDQYENADDELWTVEDSGGFSRKQLAIRTRSVEIPVQCDLNVSPEDHNFFEDLRMIASRLTLQEDCQREAVINLILHHKEHFSEKPGCTNIYEHKIRLINDKPFIRRSYPIPIALKSAVDLEIREMLRSGIIERSISPFCNPLRIVQKKDNRVRICLDARYLNDIIESDNESPSLIAEILQKYFGVEYFSSVDLTHGYWQISLERESRPYTAFLHGSTLYQFCRIPFGLKTAGSGFIRALNIAFNNDFTTFLTPYVDDLLVASNNFKQHLEHLDLIFTRLKQYNFTLRLRKSTFFSNTLPFLGFILSTEGVSPDPEKLKIIRDFAQPENKKQLQKFFGVCNYYRQFAVRYATYVEPFRNLLRDDTVWNWTEEHSRAYTEVKNNFINTVILKHFNPNNPIKLQTDSSDKGISGILYQTNDRDEQNLIGFG